MEWIVHYWTRPGRAIECAEAPTRDAALDLACARLHDGDDVLFVEGPKGETIGRQKIDEYCAQKR